MVHHGSDQSILHSKGFLKEKFRVHLLSLFYLYDDIRSIPKTFKFFFINLAVFLIKLPNPRGKCNLQSVFRYYSSFTISVKFCLSNTSEGKILKIMTNIDSSEAAGADKLSAIFLKMAPTF